MSGEWEENPIVRQLMGLGPLPHQGRALMAEGACATFTITPGGKGLPGRVKIAIDQELKLELDAVDVENLQRALAACGDMRPGQVTFSLIFPREQ